MPIVNISSLPPTDASVIPKMLESVRDAGALALQTTQDNIWVVFTPLQHYLRGDHSAVTPPKETPPPIVIIKAQSGRSPQARTSFAKAVSAEVGRSLLVSPGRVWIQYQEMNPKDVWFNGHWSD